MNKTAFLALAALVVTGYHTHADGTTSTNKTAVGAGIGALAGGVLGNRLDKDNRALGTVIGAAAGAAAGGGLGYMMDRQEAPVARPARWSAPSMPSRSSASGTTC